MTTRSTHSPSLHSATKASVPKSHLRKEAESILKTTNASVISNASVWTPADDKSIAHVDVTKSPSDEFPLPAGWARVYSVTHDKWFFANANTQSTSWVDPRDAFWKRANWDECDRATNETPYGWEISADPVVGLYFIDHINHVNTMDDPRINKFELQMSLLRYFFAVERDGMLASKRAVLADRVSELANAEQGIQNDNSGGLGALEVNAELRFQVERLTEELEDMESDTTELDQMTNRMEVDNFDQLRTQKTLQAGIEDLKREFMHQAGLRKTYEEDMEQLISVDVNSISQLPTVPAPSTEVETFNHYVELKDDQQTPSSKSTRLERELSLLELKKQIRAITRQNKALKKITQSARVSISAALASPTKSTDFTDEDGRPIVPSWEKTINEYISNAENQPFTDLEHKAKRNEELTFKEKILLLASSSKETWSNLKNSETDDFVGEEED